MKLSSILKDYPVLSVSDRPIAEAFLSGRQMEQQIHSIGVILWPPCGEADRYRHYRNQGQNNNGIFPAGDSLWLRLSVCVCRLQWRADGKGLV